MRKANQTKDVYVLLVEDDPDRFRYIQELLQRIERDRYWVVWAASYERARFELDERVFDVALIDDRIGQLTGLDFIAEVGPLHPHCPMILVTDAADLDIGDAAEQAGAADYLAKDNLSEGLLERSIRCARRSAQRRALLDGVLTHAATGVVGLDTRGMPVIWNRKALEALGLDDGGPVEVSAEVVADALDRIGAGDALPAEITRSDGRSFELSHSRIRNGGAVAVLHDVTDRVEVEARLRQALAESERASAAKSRFLAAMSHELRTPLNGILGMTRVLEGTALDEMQRDSLDVIRGSGATLLDIVNDVLDLSKIEAGCMELEQNEIPVGDLVDDVVRLLAPIAAEKGVELAAFVDPRSTPTIRGDALRVRQVLTNLIGNAVKFTSAGSVLVMVEEVRSGARPAVRFAITDTGIGIPSAKLDKLFVRFSQVDASTAREFGGTGLGLALCQELVGLMGGEISCSSLPDHGTTFSFLLPLEEDGELHAVPRRTVGHSAGPHMFIASPSAGVVNILGSYVRAVDGTIASATSVEAAHRLSQSGRFDAAILDGAFGAFGVDELLHRLREKPAGPGRSFLLEGVPGQGRELGLGENDVLARPLVRQTFDRILRQLRDAGAPMDVDSPPADVGAFSRRLRILMAEDNPANQRVATALLKAAGFRLAIVDNGQAAIARATVEEFDIILMDVQMPVMDGLVATRRLREHEALKNVPIVGLTAGAMEEDRTKCLGSGMTAYLSKPIDWDKLLAMLDCIERERYGGSTKVVAA